VCVCVCSSFECLDIQTSSLLHRYMFVMSILILGIKVIGLRSGKLKIT